MRDAAGIVTGYSTTNTVIQRSKIVSSWYVMTRVKIWNMCQPKTKDECSQLFYFGLTHWNLGKVKNALVTDCWHKFIMHYNVPMYWLSTLFYQTISGELWLMLIAQRKAPEKSEVADVDSPTDVNNSWLDFFSHN